jgi:hypothetical protein
MRSKSLSLLLAAGLSVLVTGCGSSTASSTPSGTSMAMAAGHPCAGYGSQAIGTYDVLVAVESHAPIVSAADAASSTDPDTHIIVAGTGVENAESANKHVEVHICDHASGAPVQHLTPTVTLQDLTSGGAATPIAVAEVYPKGSAPTDVHYGNNVAFPAGHQAQVVVTVGSASGTFKIAVE